MNLVNCKLIHKQNLAIIYLRNKFIMNLLKHRDAPEPTGDEPDDADFEMPKIYEPVSYITLLCQRAL